MHVKNDPDTYSVDEIDLFVGGQKIDSFTRGEITDREAQALGLATDEAAKIHVDELIALLGSDLVQVIGERSSKLPKHIQMIAARVAFEQGLDPVRCLDDLDQTLERMGTDEAFGDSIRALGKRLGAPASLQGAMVPRNRKARRAEKAQARGRK